MYRYFNKLKSAKSGQAAVILLLIIAVALIFYAVTLNFGNATETKTLTTSSANQGASLLASQMAGYGQSLFKQTLGGADGDLPKKCGDTGILSAIIGLVVAIVIVVALMVITAGAASAVAPTLLQVMAGKLLTAAIISMAMAAVNLTLQMAVIQPGITSAWSKQSKAALSLTDRFVETGLRTGVQRLVDDPVNVPDLHDLDQDRFWGIDGATGEPNDTISRYSVYYENRLNDVKKLDTANFNEFFEGVEDFLYQTGAGDDWGVLDPVPDCADRPDHPCCNDPRPSQCNPCCVPAETLSSGGLVQRPFCCDCIANGTCTDLEDQCGVSTTCRAESPYGDTNVVNNSHYKHVYDPLYQDKDNDFVSFLERLGVDDEHQKYYRDLDDPGAVWQSSELNGQEGFRWQDTDGEEMEFSKMKGVYPLFHKVDGWAWDLSTLDFNNVDEHCFWVDENYDSTCARAFSQTLPDELLVPLRLPRDPDDLAYNKNPYVDSVNDNIPGNPPLASDRIYVPETIVAASNECAMNALVPVADPDIGIWKKGMDHYCTEGDISTPLEWPYSQGCPKHSSCLSIPNDPTSPMTDCQCGESNVGSGAEFTEDALDDIYNGLREFAIFSKKMIELDTDTSRDIEIWYPYWEDLLVSGLRRDGTARVHGEDCLDCDGTDGLLVRVHKEIDKVSQRLAAWEFRSYEGESCEDAWCVPKGADNTRCSLVHPEEKATFGRGAMDDVINCLDHNANFKGGNDVRFRKCGDACTAASEDKSTVIAALVLYNRSNAFCGDEELPRSLVSNPIFDPTGEFDPANISRLTTLFECRGQCTGCNVSCESQQRDGFGSCTQNLVTCFDACSDNVCRNTCYQTFRSCWRSAFDNWFSCRRTCRCAGFDCTDDVLPRPPSQDFQDAIQAAKGSCGETGVSSYAARILVSADEAENQVVKFRQRISFLRARLLELQEVRQVFDKAKQEFDEFFDPITGVVTTLIQARMDLLKIQANLPLPNHVIYGWRDPVRDDGNESKRYWHIVKADARIPRRCDNACSTDQSFDGVMTEWPRVKTYTKSMGTKRCYELDDDEGTVKFRATRYDQNHKKNAVKFPNGVKIWQFRSSHPKRPDLDDTNLGEICKPYMLRDPGGTVLDEPNLYKDAFMLNLPPLGLGAVDFDALTPQDLLLNPSKAVTARRAMCWLRVHELLSTGVTSETCAKYYFHQTDDGDRQRGMSFHFVPCRPF